MDKSSEDNLTTRSLLKRILATEPVRIAVKHPSQKSQHQQPSASYFEDENSSSPSMNLRSKMKGRVRRSLRKSAVETSIFKRNTKSSSKSKPKSAIVEDLDDITPRTLLKKIIQNEDEVSIIVSQRSKEVAVDDKRQENTPTAKLSSVGSLNLSLPDFQETETITAFRKSRQKRKIRVSEFEREVDQRLPKKKDNYNISHENFDVPTSSVNSYTMSRSIEDKLDISAAPESTFKRGLLRRPNKIYLVSLGDFEQGVEDKYQLLKGSQECFIESAEEDKSDSSSNEVAQMNTELYAQPLHRDTNLSKSERRQRGGPEENANKDIGRDHVDSDEEEANLDLGEAEAAAESGEVAANSGEAEAAADSGKGETAADTGEAESDSSEAEVAANSDESALDINEGEEVANSDEAEAASDIEVEAVAEAASDIEAEVEADSVEVEAASDSGEAEAASHIGEAEVVANSVEVEAEAASDIGEGEEEADHGESKAASDSGEDEAAVAHVGDKVGDDLKNVESNLKQNKSSLTKSRKSTGVGEYSHNMQGASRSEENGMETAESLHVHTVSVSRPEESPESSENSDDENLDLAKNVIDHGIAKKKKPLMLTALPETPAYFKSARFARDKPVISEKVQRPKSVKPKKRGSFFSSSQVKRIFTHHAQVRVSKEALAVVEKCLDVYVNQLADDLSTYTAHADRKTITRADMELLMKRQRLVTDTTPLNVLIEKHLPLEYRTLLIPCATSGNKLIPKK